MEVPIQKDYGLAHSQGAYFQVPMVGPHLS